MATWLNVAKPNGNYGHRAFPYKTEEFVLLLNRLGCDTCGGDDSFDCSREKFEAALEIIRNYWTTGKLPPSLKRKAPPLSSYLQMVGEPVEEIIEDMQAFLKDAGKKAQVINFSRF